MPEQNDLLGKWRHRRDDERLREVFGDYAAEPGERAEPSRAPVELNRAVQLWLECAGWRHSLDPRHVVINDFVSVHPEAGDLVVRIISLDAEQWERAATDGLHTALPEEFNGLAWVRRHRVRRHHVGAAAHAAAVMVNRDTGQVSVEIFAPEQLSDGANPELTALANYVEIDRRENLHIHQPKPWRTTEQAICGTKPNPHSLVDHDDLPEFRYVDYVSYKGRGRRYGSYAIVSFRGEVRKLCDVCMSGGDKWDDAEAS